MALYTLFRKSPFTPIALLALLPASPARAWIPTAGPQITRYAGCTSANLEQEILDQKGDAQGEQDVVRAFFRNCGDLLSSSSTVNNGLLFQAEGHSQIMATEYKGA